jgi:hypothetical protein
MQPPPRFERGHLARWSTVTPGIAVVQYVGNIARTEYGLVDLSGRDDVPSGRAQVDAEWIPTVAQLLALCLHDDRIRIRLARASVMRMPIVSVGPIRNGAEVCGV